MVAILKPVGLATQAPPGIESVEQWLRDRLGRDASGYLGVPHRLDRAVSGVVLMAATPRAARKLSRQFEGREIAKTYLAVVAVGTAEAQLPGADAVEWRDLLRKIPEEARSEVVDSQALAAREAITHASWIDCAGRDEGKQLLKFMPVTGRMHQLRVQAASRGLPIVGDELYGGPPLGDCDGDEQPLQRHRRVRCRRPRRPQPDL